MMCEQNSNKPEPDGRSARIYISWIVAAILVGALIRAGFVLDWLGEQDAARMVIRAAKLGTTSCVTAKGLAPSMLYVDFVRLLLDHGVSLNTLPLILNWINFVVGILILAPIAGLAWLFGGGRVAVVAVVVIQTMPAFWLGSVYGYPHFVAYLFLVSAVLWFGYCQKKIQASGQVDRGLEVLQVSITMLLLFIVLGIKIDFVLSFGVFPALTLLVPQPQRKRLLLKSVITLSMPFVLLLLVQKMNAPAVAASMVSAMTLPQYLAHWRSTFPFTLKALIAPKNIAEIVTAVGPVYYLAILPIIAIFVHKKKNREPLLVLAAWVLPLMLFWGSIMGSSARHNLVSTVPLAIILGLGLSMMASRQKWIALLALLVLANYFCMPVRDSTVIPSTRLLSSANRINARIGLYKEYGNKVAALHDSRIAVIESWVYPYILYGVIAAARSFACVDGNSYNTVSASGTRQIYRFDYVYDNPTQARLLARTLKSQGWKVWSSQYVVDDLPVDPGEDVSAN